MALIISTAQWTFSCALPRMGRIPPLPFMCVEGRGGTIMRLWRSIHELGRSRRAVVLTSLSICFSRSSVMDIGTHGHCGICHHLNCCTRSCFWDILGDRPVD